MHAADSLAERAGEFLVRAMVPEDIPDVMGIDRGSFPNPWPESTYWYELRKNPASHLLVIQSREDGQVVGVAGYWLVIDEAHIATFAVHPDWRGRGLGKVLLSAMLRHAHSHGAASATLEVRAGNAKARALYRGFGFRVVGRRKGYYKNNGEDAVLMTAEPIGSRDAYPLQEERE
ncbi:MAG: ribosomal protein S18-alanine N-acetyltransferase [Anaerolineales bacterium]|jgi:ribosomal-protein-alanine N-acetyltransferase